MKQQNTATFSYAIIFCSLVFCIILFPNEAYSSALDGLKLWFNVVCPALLPFFICVEILIGLGIVSFLGGIFKPLMQPIFRVPGEAAFAFFMSISSGYPVGSKITAELRQNKTCTKAEGQRILSLCSTSGPLFIIGAVATGILGNPKLGFFLALAHYFSALTVGFFMRFYGPVPKDNFVVSYRNPIKDMLNYHSKDGRTIGILMGDAVRNGFNLVIIIGGFIVFFSVVACVLKISGLLTFMSNIFSGALNFVMPALNLTPSKVSAILVGMLEITNGINMCAALPISLIDKSLIISFLIGFGGLSVNAQVLSMISGTDLRFGLYLVVKIFQGFCAVLYTYFFLGFLKYTSVFNDYRASVNSRLLFLNHSNSLNIFTHSFFYLLSSICIILIIVLITNKKALYQHITKKS